MEAAKKLDLISKLIAIDDDTTLNKVALIIAENKSHHLKAAKFSNLAGTWSDEEADTMKQEIEKAFEQIHPDDWK